MKREGKFAYNPGETVRIKRGIFASFTGKILETDKEKLMVKVIIKFQDRWRIIELRSLDVEQAPPF